MITVRFPNGTAVQYNTANFLEYGDNYWRLYTDQGRSKILATVQVSAGVMVEFVPACRVYNPTRSTSLRELVDAVLAHRSPSWSEGAEIGRLKRELQKFNIQRRTWSKP